MFSTTKLSQGQRKRLALLTSLIEARPIHIFDEWAADQDPHYKEIFYSKLLPGLKAQGKTIIVVTHDDRYFHKGDRVVKLEDGKIVQSG
jgi:putative ATP-binding cassette transporter